MTLATELFNLAIRLDGVDLEPEADGYLGELEGRQLVLSLRDLPASFTPVRVDNRKSVALAKNHGTPNYRVFVTKMSMKVSNPQGAGYNTSVFHTEYPSNMTCVIEIDGDTVRYHEIAIISQAGEFWVTNQVTREGTMYQQDGALKVDCFGNWPQMLEKLSGLVDASSLKQYPGEPDEPKLTPIPEGEGEVVWFNFAQGLGMIRTMHGNARVHWSEIAVRTDEPERSYLLPGQRVSYADLREPVNTKGRATAFKLEAVDVRVLS